MAKLICDKKNFDVNKVRVGEYYPVWVYEKIWNIAGAEARRQLKSIDHKPKTGFANGRESAFYQYRSATAFRKLFEEKTDCRETTIETLIKAMARTDKNLVKKKPRTIKPTNGKGSKNKTPIFAGSVRSGVGFALEESKSLGCDPEKYVESVERAISSGHFQTA